MTRDHRIWAAELSTSQQSTALRMAAQNATAAQIASHLHKPVGRVEKFLRDSGGEGQNRQTIDFSQSKQRHCLGCQKLFLSQGTHNRLCRSCREHRGSVSPFEP